MQNRKLFFVVASIGGIIFLFFFMIWRDNKKYDKYTTINYILSVDLLVRKVRQKRGIIVLNDSLVMLFSNKLISQDPGWIVPYLTNERPKGLYSPSLVDVDPPYRILKHSNDSIVNIIKYKDTLSFKFWEENPYDANDLTFKEFFSRLFD